MSDQAPFVLVPGGWHGGWWWEGVAAGLRRHGHRAHPVTLSGLGDDAEERLRANLDTHVEDVVRRLEWERLEGAVLCGHSYGGMVVSAVADRVPERLSRLVYVDAYVPADGDSCCSLTSDAYREAFVRGCGGDGRSVLPRAGLDPRTRPHPLASFLQRVRLTRPPDPRLERDYVFLSGWSGTPFAGVYRRLRRDPAWRTFTLPTGHNVMAEAPGDLLRILLDPASAAE